MKEKTKIAETDLPIEPLLVIDELIVGPVKIEPDRLVMLYTIVQNGQQHTNELIYKYEEPVFDPELPETQNLCSLIGAQLALNYGLFCHKLIFDGLFDRTDQRFLLDMLENTSKEILVNKFYLPNVFLTGEAAQLPVVKRKKYTQASVTFVNTAFPTASLRWIYWATDRHKHCVLSSGGKESLVSYGLLRELGKEIHPIFGNESGRHWFTALNGFRYLKEIEPNTARVWMNSDRIFSWVLRHLPFVRPDFAQVRSDDYPVRLWTVALFLFGVLPLLKKRGIGRLVIGDEYDTTQRSTFEGIQHYNGLYDQSRFFDEALSRFYLRKGWAISQFSLLRSLSEMQALHILVKRYPELQANQTSCHSTHEKGGRMWPCGKCEKCRRVVGMLTALGGDPTRCGYTPQQIEQCLAALNNNKLKQLGPDAAHLLYLLKEAGALKGDDKRAQAHPNIMKLRFDKERSSLAGLPLDLRRPLYEIMLQYAGGAVRMVNRKWEDFNPLSSPEMELPYPFEMNRQETRKPAGEDRPWPMLKPLHEKYLWGELTWEEAEQRIQHADVAILPVGAIEQHGPHLPLDVDAFDADYLARKVAEACDDPRPLVLPLVPYGVSYHHDDFKGTISISNEAMSRFIYDIGMSAARNGITKLIILNGHGDNAPTLSYAAQMINRDAEIFVCVDTGETSDMDLYSLIDTRNDIHAGEIETSTTLAVRPELVHMEKARDMTLLFSNRYLDFSSNNSVPWYVRTKHISANGVMGNPEKATIEKGKKMWEIMIAHLVAFVEELKTLTLTEIYQKKY